ncbi:hypothetical protein LXL04_006644 [Taraxacum kok-saghyz]
MVFVGGSRRKGKKLWIERGGIFSIVRLTRSWCSEIDIGKELQALLLLSSLPKSCYGTVPAISSSGKSTKMTFQGIKILILNKDVRRQSDEGASSSLLKGRGSNKGGNGEITTNIPLAYYMFETVYTRDEYRQGDNDSQLNVFTSTKHDSISSATSSIDRHGITNPTRKTTGKVQFQETMKLQFVQEERAVVDSKFPKQVKPPVGVNESEEIIAAKKLCPYQRCSFHGHHHPHERLAFLSMGQAPELLK